MMLYTEGAKQRELCQYVSTRLRHICVQAVTNWREDSGAELLEAALVIPVLLMLLMAIVSFGGAYSAYQTMTRAAREGARELVLTPCAIYPNCPGSNAVYTAGDIYTDFVEPALENASLNPQKVANYSTTYVFLDPNDPTPDICGVQISFDYPYKLSIPFTTLNLSTITLKTKVQMRLENQPDPCPAGTSY